MDHKLMLLLIFVLWTLFCQKGIFMFAAEWFVEATDATLYTHPLTWNDANQHCKSIGQNLVTIDKYSKSQLLLKSYSDNSYQSSATEVWIGLHSPDPDNPRQFKWADDCSSSRYEHWEITYDKTPDKFCTYVNVYNMKWNLAPCNTVIKSFMCEQQKSICTSGFYYEVFIDIMSYGQGGTAMYGTTTECENNCNSIASSTFCWGFLNTKSIAMCGPYDVIDDPYYNDDTGMQEAFRDVDLHVRRCNYDVSIVTTPITVIPDNSCGKVLVSNCSTFLCPTTTTDLQTTQEESTTEMQTAQEESTTEMQTTQEESTTEMQTTQEESTTEIQTTQEESTTEMQTTQEESTTEMQTTHGDFTTVTKDDLQTTDVVTTTEVTSLHTTHGDSSTSTSQYSTNAFSQTNTDIEMTTTGVIENTTYCECPCRNVTSTLTLEESVKKIVDHLTIDKTNTSFSIRKRTSAEDKRPSSVGIGYVGIAILLSVFGFFICLDFHVLIVNLCRLCKNVSK